MEQTDTDQKGGAGKQCWKEGEGTSQRTQGLTVGAGGGLGGGGQWGENWDNCNKIIKNKNKKEVP